MVFFIPDNDLCDNIQAQFEEDFKLIIFSKNRGIPIETKVKY